MPGKNLSPLDAARALAGREGAFFLDSALPDSLGISLLGAEPDLVMEGRDWKRLEEELEKRKPRADAPGLAGGAAVGCVAFDGWFRFGFYDRPHICSHGTQRWENPPDFPGDRCPHASERIDFRPRVSREDFLAMVARAKEYIAAGDIYQVCLSHPFEAPAGPGAAWGFFERLRAISPAPFSAYLDIGGARIASASPECFLKMRGRHIVTRPIKGTRPRKPDPQLDELSASDLMSSPKEIAELIMITDLERNDLGQVCEFGSVSATGLLELEKFEQVHHLVSTVEGRLREGISHPRALRECFPGGSISGAPKKRALEIIRELEPLPRGLYTGAIGYFGYCGESQFSIAIRTAVFEENSASFHAGAGIVADSIPEKEWQETLDKASGLLRAAAC